MKNSTKPVGRPKSVLGDTTKTTLTYSTSRLEWLRERARTEKTVPSVIVDRALAREQALVS